MDNSLPISETPPESFTGEKKTRCEWSDQSKETLIASGEKWSEAMPFNLLDPKHRGVASDMIDSFNQIEGAYKILLTRSEFDIKDDTKDLACLMYKSLLPSKS